MSESVLLNPRSVRTANEVKVELGDGTFVRARKEDMTALVFEGKVPMPMLAAVQKMIAMPNATPVERVQALGDQGQSMIDLLREHACNVVIEPKIVMTDTTDPDTVPVTYLTLAQLMAIWSATAVAPKMGPSQAARFRPGGVVDAPAPAPTGEDVRPPAELVAPAGVEVVSQ